MSRRSVLPILAVLSLAFLLPPPARSQDTDADQQQQDAQAQAKAKQKKREKDLYNELLPAYKEWLNGPVSYIITPEERSAFLHLETNQERENFIEAFWERRNPDPGSADNTYKEDYYERIAYANEHFSSGIPGWKTDRGRIYLMWGKPDDVESHPSGGPYTRPA
ncbi:MAG: GWxTD domain-containing protein, partial [Candidatus Acidiferrales bacterium]